jgi:hypothetical protein
MTTPPGALLAVAAWDVPAARRAVASLEAVADRLPVRRLRVDEVGRTLAGCWSGPAARAATATVVTLSGVGSVVAGALRNSLAAFLASAAAAAAAQEAALRAIAAPTAMPSPGVTAVVDRLAGRAPTLPLPVGTAAEEAFRLAAVVADRAAAAGRALAAVGVSGSSSPIGFAELSTRIRGDVVCLPRAPAGRPAAEVAAWWSGLSLAAQQAAIRTVPHVVGALDGVPARARDRANRLLLHRALADPGLTGRAATTARAVATRLTELARRGRPAQLHLFDLAGDRVALALGDPDTADAVALLVPGMSTTPGDDLGRLVGDAQAVAAATGAAAPGLAVAVVVWLGYRTPGSLAAAGLRAPARRGGAALAAALDGLAAARDATGRPPARTTVLAHSYGTVVVDEAADLPGALAADAVVLLGSPGMEDDAASLEAEEVYDAASFADPVSWLGRFGASTWAPGYGSAALPVRPGTGHTGYYDDGPTLAALGDVVAGSGTAPDLTRWEE